MKVTKSIFGKLPDGRRANLYKFETASGLTVCITNYGGIITSIQTPDKNGHCSEITAGFQTLEKYIDKHPYFGSIVGRYANRIANGRFTINDIPYDLSVNDPPNHLHGGVGGFDSKLWDDILEQNTSDANLQLKYCSWHLEEGYPGNLHVSVKYSIFDYNIIEMVFEATTDAATHVNLTNHAYFNLGGFKDDVFDHCLWLNSKQYLATDKHKIPTGSLVSCLETEYDYFSQQSLMTPNRMVQSPMDHCFISENRNPHNQPVGVLFHPETGRRLIIYGSQPGIQVYTSNFLDGSLIGHQNTVYKKHMAICLENQHFPNAPNTKDFPETLLLPQKKYRQWIRWHFDYT